VHEYSHLQIVGWLRANETSFYLNVTSYNFSVRIENIESSIASSSYPELCWLFWLISLHTLNIELDDKCVLVIYSPQPTFISRNMIRIIITYVTYFYHLHLIFVTWCDVWLEKNIILLWNFPSLSSIILKKTQWENKQSEIFA